MARGKVITTHLRTGDPNGIRTVFISNKICFDDGRMTFPFPPQ